MSTLTQRNKHWISGAILLLLLLLACPWLIAWKMQSTATAMSRQMTSPLGSISMQKDLDLTAEQKRKIQHLEDQYRSELRNLCGQHCSARMKIGELLQAQQGMYASQQLVLIHRFDEEIIGAAHDPVDAVVLTVHAGEQDHGDQAGFRFGLHRLTNFKSSWAGHHHIQQREINQVAAHLVQRLPAVCRADDLVTLCNQQCGEQFAVSFVVIGQKNGFMMVLQSRHIASSTIISTEQKGLRTSTLVERWKGG